MPSKKMPKTIYVVTEGEYSDYRIMAVFSSKKKADAYFKEVGSSNSVEEYVLDEQSGWVGVKLWQARIRISDGQLCELGQDYSQTMVPSPRHVESQVSTAGDCIIVKSAVSSNHAEKVAVERRQKHLREASRAKQP